MGPIYLSIFLWGTPFPSQSSTHQPHPPAPLIQYMRDLTLVEGQAEKEGVKKEQMSGKNKQKKSLGELS